MTATTLPVVAAPISVLALAFHDFINAALRSMEDDSVGNSAVEAVDTDQTDQTDQDETRAVGSAKRSTAHNIYKDSEFTMYNPDPDPDPMRGIERYEKGVSFDEQTVVEATGKRRLQ